MTFQEIKKMCEDIDYYAGPKMKADDMDEFKRLYRRVKEDEDLDSASVKKLEDIYRKYLK
jgi:hypothetical protein